MSNPITAEPMLLPKTIHSDAKGNIKDDSYFYSEADLPTLLSQPLQEQNSLSESPEAIKKSVRDFSFDTEKNNPVTITSSVVGKWNNYEELSDLLAGINYNEFCKRATTSEMYWKPIIEERLEELYPENMSEELKKLKSINRATRDILEKIKKGTKRNFFRKIFRK